MDKYGVVVCPKCGGQTNIPVDVTGSESVTKLACSAEICNCGSESVGSTDPSTSSSSRPFSDASDD